MERKVKIQDRIEGQAIDIQNIQDFVDASLQHIIMDAITGERLFVGLVATSPSATELAISEGRLWEGDTGKVYRKDQATTFSVVSHLPVLDEKWLALSVYGEEIETDIQTRDFLVDLDTGQTEPRAVPMEIRRQVASQVTAGLESPDPQKPEPPTGYTIIAQVRVNPSGVQEIQLADNRKLMRLFEVYQTVLANAAWIAAASAKIAAIISDLAALTSKIDKFKQPINLNEIAADVALLKDRLELPDTYTSYGGDLFLDLDESATGETEYYARVDEGIRFPWAGQTEQQPALFNPNDAGVVNMNGLLLPAYQEVRRLETTGYAGDLLLSQYSYDTHELKLGYRTKVRVRYGPTREVCSNGVGWQEGGYDFVKNVFEGPETGYQVLEQYDEHGGHWWYRIRQYWRDTYQEPYWFIETLTHQVDGYQVAQTFISPSTGWLAGIDLYFTKAAADGAVHVHLCQTAHGLPDQERCLIAATVDAADMKIHPLKTFFKFPEPVYVKAGERYAYTVTTGGAHKAAMVQGTELSNGTFFHSTDGAYFQGDFSKDMMFGLVYAQFDQNRVTAELAPMDLSNGIADLDLLMEAVVPDGTNLVIEYQKSGDATWYPVDPYTAGQLLGLPAMLKMRAVFVGSHDLMPGFALAGSRFQANRPAVTFKHISVQRTLPAASENIDVILLLEAWNGAKHTCDCKLLSGGNTYNASGTVDLQMDATTIKRTFTFAPEPGVGISDYQIQAEGTTITALECFHVAKRMDVAK